MTLRVRQTSEQPLSPWVIGTVSHSLWRSPKILAVQYFDRNDVQIEVVKQPGIDRDLLLFRVRLVVDPFGALGIGAAATNGAMMMLDRIAPPLVGGDAVPCGRQRELLRSVIGAERPRLEQNEHVHLATFAGASAISNGVAPQ